MRGVTTSPRASRGEESKGGGAGAILRARDCPLLPSPTAGRGCVVRRDGGRRVGGCLCLEMLHAESRVRLLECQDEVTAEPCSKKMKSTEGAFENLPDCGKQGIQEGDPDRTSNDLIPVCVSDNEGDNEVQKQEKIPVDVLGATNEVLPEGNLEFSQAVDSVTVQNINPPLVSINDTEDEEKEDPLTANDVNEDNTKNSCKAFSVNRNESDGEFITSKEFIGPIYKPAESNTQDQSGSCDDYQSGVGDGMQENKTKGTETKNVHAVSSAASGMDDELDQFYKEIHQLESENLNMLQEKETKTSQEECSVYNCSQASQEDYQHVLLDSPQPFYENGQYFSGEQGSQKISNEQQFVMERSGWKTENAFNGQMESSYSVPEFRPTWQSTAPFIVPQGPPPPRLTHQAHFQILNSPQQNTNAFPLQNDELSYENYYGYCENQDINLHGPVRDQSSYSVDRTDFHSTQVFRNGNNHQNHHLQSNGFCETREEYWKEPKTYSAEGMHRFSSPPEERFDCLQKVLLILRGLPGSGKSTLSRFLLDHSRDGIVLSTDDYFRQQDGYTYNAAQLGDAHDWNQKRAKQAMEQGKSPVIIDNTNTQAWEMKPYVEVALEKGYRVEFREPDTWWKFDPEELEKRNKHGVTREKIAQMLERYEYQISIPIVMNSELPPHKHTQRPPVQRRHRERILKQNRGHPLAKVKQRRKRKRNKRTKLTEITKQNVGGAAHLSPDNQETSESEGDDSEEENRKSLCVSGEGPEDPVGGCEERPNGDTESGTEAVSSPVLEISAVPNGVLTHEVPVESDSSLLTDKKPLCTGSTTESVFDGEEVNQRHRGENLCKSGCIQEAECNSNGNSLLSSTESKLKSTCEPDVEAEQLHLNGEEKEVSLCHNSKVHYKVPDSNTDNKSAVTPEEKNCSDAWASFSVSSSAEELQQGFDTQLSPSWSEDQFVSEQRQKKARKPEQMCTNNSRELNCPQPSEGLVKENQQEMVTEEAGNIQSSGLLASPPGEKHVGSLVEPRSASTLRSMEVNASGNDAALVAPKKKRYRRIVNLAPKFNLPREIAGGTEGGEEVPLKADGPSESVLEVEQKGFLHQDRGLGHEQSLVFQEYAAPHSGPQEPYSLPSPGVDSPLRAISYFHLGQSSPMPKFSCSVSTTKEERAQTPRQQQAVGNRVGESEQTSSDVTSSQPDILSSVKADSEHAEDLSILERCVANVHKTDGTEPAEASPPAFKQDGNVKASFLRLPLSIGFAFQLVQLFGSPGLPLGEAESKWVVEWKCLG
ncbi:NEDD4-binding protein 2-like 2 isoform X2 [Excalfactoria chinensis]|uniref:NEDD4-binding protein 2-like 2 isoform X2 n=1 Tax=Excalfactoria chinensis TaxID=46218 RepID=UPI003B3AFB4B